MLDGQLDTHVHDIAEQPGARPLSQTVAHIFGGTGL